MAPEDTTQPPSGDALDIRLARPHEYEAVGELTVLAYDDVLHGGPADPYRHELLDAAQRATEAELWVVADHAHRIVGTVTVGRPGSPYAEIAGPDEIEVRMLAIDPSYSRQGIGRRLMAHVHTMGAGEGFHRSVLSVIDTSAAAIGFYRSLGYQHLPERDWHPRDDLDLQLLVFALDLHP